MNIKKQLFIGGLPEEADEKLVESIFMPFGEVLDVQIPLDFKSQKNRGFAFIEFECTEDAAAAVDNMNDSELYGRTLKVNYSNPAKRGDISNKPIWTDEKWFEKYAEAPPAEADNEEVETAAKNDSEAQEPIPVCIPSRYPQVFFEIAIAGIKSGRISIELRTDLVPLTCENFRCLCTHEKGFGYRGMVIYRIIPDFMCQAGDIVNNDGSFGKSIYGRKFNDENFELKHSTAGSVAMANSGPDTNSSNFFITFSKTPWLDGKNVVFGHVVGGMNVLHKIAALGTKGGKPRKKITVCDCGQLC